MNIERMLFLADYIEALPPESFNMGSWCGTACCIAGHTLVAFDVQIKHSTHIPGAAMRLLELTCRQAWVLFHGYFAVDAGTPIGEITRQEAADAIRQMVADELAAMAPLPAIPSLAVAVSG